MRRNENRQTERAKGDIRKQEEKQRKGAEPHGTTPNAAFSRTSGAWDLAGGPRWDPVGATTLWSSTLEAVTRLSACGGDTHLEEYQGIAPKDARWYTHVFVHVYKDTRMHMHTSTHTYARIHMYTHMHTPTHICIHAHTYARAHTHTHIQVCIYVYTYTHTLIHIHMFSHTYICVHRHIHTEYTRVCTHLYVHMPTYAHIHTYAGTCTHVPSYPYTHMHMHVQKPRYAQSPHKSKSTHM